MNMFTPNNMGHLLGQFLVNSIQNSEIVLPRQREYDLVIQCPEALPNNRIVELLRTFFKRSELTGPGLRDTGPLLVLNSPDGKELDLLVSNFTDGPLRRLYCTWS